MLKLTLITSAALAFLSVAAMAESASPKGAKVFIVEPKAGATVSSPVTVKFGIEGMDISPAGTEKANSGHHHLVIDGKVDDMKAAIPADANHVHFGKGQTEATVELKPGEHTLQLVLGDHNHVPHNPPVVSEVVKITVK